MVLLLLLNIGKALENDAKFKVLVTRKWPSTVEKLEENFDVTLNESDIPMTEELLEAMNSYDAVLPTVTDSISSKIISSDKRKAKILGNFGVGFNNIDIESAKINGVVVTNTPEVLTDCTADIAMLLLLGVSRRASEGEFLLEKRMVGLATYPYDGNKSNRKNFGLVGMGNSSSGCA